MKRWFPLLPSPVILLFLPFYGATQVIKPKTLNQGWEIWFDKIPVSGDLRVGLMNDFSAQKLLNPSTFYCTIPAVHPSNLCVEISSQNGRYEAELEYDISKLPAGEHQFQLPTSYAEKLKSFTPKDIAILVRGSNVCGDKSGAFYYARWSMTPKSDTLFALLNSENPTIIKIEESSGNIKEIQCDKLTDPSAVAYNCICKIPIKAIQKAKDITIIHRVRRGPVTKIIPYAFEIKT